MSKKPKYKALAEANRRASKMVKGALASARRPRTATLYLGWDGAYVLSKHLLTAHIDKSDGDRLRYLSTGVMHSIADLGPEGAVVFGDLKLKKYEVVKLKIEIVKP